MTQPVRTMTGSLVLWICLMGWVSVEAREETNCRRKCQEQSCEAQMLKCFSETEQARKAIEYLKTRIQKAPGGRFYYQHLAQAYLADHNPFWAVRTLQQAIARDKTDCQSRSWLAWVYIHMGYLDLAQEILAQPSCPITKAQQARWLLLKMTIARLKENRPIQIQAWDEISDASQMFPDDYQLWKHLHYGENPGWIEPLHLRVEFFGGYSSNSRAGLPIDPAFSGPASALSRLDVLGRLVWPTFPRIRPSVDLGLRGHGLSTKEASELSYLELSIRPGVILGADRPRMLLGYKMDGLFLNQTQNQPFYKAHRLEMELEFEDFTIFGGTGRRLFSESARTRTEFDFGSGFWLRLTPSLRLALAGSLRYYLAKDKVWRQWGMTTMALADWQLGSGFLLRLGLSFGLDHYPLSGGIPGRESFGTRTKRFEMFNTLYSNVWSPAWHGIRLGVGYDFSWRDSTADTSVRDYDYREHRLGLKMRWVFDFNPWAPRVVEPKYHVPLPYNISGYEAVAEEERIQDLLRQYESDLSGSCGCGH